MENITSTGFLPKNAIFIFDNVTSGFRAASLNDFTPKTKNTSNATPSGTAIANSYGVCLQENTSRVSLLIQNLGSGGALFVKRGVGASSASHHVVIKSDTAEFAGNGGIYTDDSYTGPISVSGHASNICKYIAWEETA